ncbi:hypothetical protein K9N50_05405 [bacterium]|nr:hypothetical protein [bacterium]
MLRCVEIKIPSAKTPERLDVFLARQVTELTRSKAQAAISEGALTVNGSTVKASYKIKPDDLIRLEFLARPPFELEAEDIPLEVLYEDSWLVVIVRGLWLTLCLGITVISLRATIRTDREWCTGWIRKPPVCLLSASAILPCHGWRINFASILSIANTGLLFGGRCPVAREKLTNQSGAIRETARNTLLDLTVNRRSHIGSYRRNLVS